MAPEQFETYKDEVIIFDHKVDIWAMGITLFQMIFNFMPYTVNEINNSKVIGQISNGNSFVCKDRVNKKFPEDFAAKE
jgi:serine/threonine protein kinase